MKINAISNNSYDSSFGSKFKCAGIDASLRINGLQYALEYGKERCDRTFLNAMNGLLNDGLSDEYIYVNSKETGNWLKMKNSQTGEHSEFSLLYYTRSSAELFRNLIVNIAREKGLISGNAVDSTEIQDIYEPYRYKPLFNLDIDNKLKKIGFQKFSKKTKEDKASIRNYIQDELNEIKKVDSSNMENKLGIIRHLEDKIYDKQCQQIHEEYEELKRIVFNN